MPRQYLTGWTRWEFLDGLTLAGTTALLGRTRELVAAEPPSETTTLRAVRSASICVAPEYVAETLLYGEGFTEVHYVKTTGTSTQALASGEADLSTIFIGQLLEEALMRLSTVCLIVALALASLMAPLAVEAQQASKVHRIGLLTPGAPPPSGASSPFAQVLRELGWVEGQNLAIEPRYAAGRLDQLPDLAAELVRLPVELIVVVSFPAALAAKQATTTIPIVIARGGDPVGTKLVASLARPGGNITGVSIPENELAGKRLQLLTEAVPGVSRVAVMWNKVDLAMSLRFSATQDAAHALRLKLQPLGVQEPRDFNSAFVAMDRERPDALFVVSDVLTTLNQQHIVAFAAQSRLPAMYEFRSNVAAGGLLSYGPSVAEMSRRAATLVDKILKGAKPADLPLEQPMHFELAINLKTARALGLTIPPHLLALADEVIQ